MEDLGIYYLVHFDQFIESHLYFLKENSQENLERTREYAYISAVKSFVELASEHFLVNIRGSERNLDDALSGFGLNDLLLQDRENLFSIYDDLYRGFDEPSGPFDKEMQRFAKLFKSATGQRFSSANHYFAGNESHDCLPSVIQALSQGTGYSSLHPLGQGVSLLHYGGPRMTRFHAVEEACWRQGQVYLNGKNGLRSEYMVPAMALGDLAKSKS